MCRHRHHCAFAITHQYIVADPDRDLFAGQRMSDFDTRVHSLLFHSGDVCFSDAALFAFLDKRSQFCITLRCLGRQRVLGCHGDEGHAHDGVGTRGVDPQLACFKSVPPFQLPPGGRKGNRPLSHRGRVREGAAGRGNFVFKGEAHAVALADPVGLHGLHLLRPAGERIQAFEQLIGVLRDAEEIHRDVALLHHRAGAPAASVDHLLVGQHRVVYRVPVHHGGLLVDDTLLEQAREQPLFPAVIVRLAGGDFA